MWPRQLADHGQTLTATAIEANIWRRSWMRTSFTPARARCQKGCRSLRRLPRRMPAMTHGCRRRAGRLEATRRRAGRDGRIWQAQDAVCQIDEAPLQGHDLVEAAVGQDQQARGENSRARARKSSWPRTLGLGARRYMRRPIPLPHLMPLRPPELRLIQGQRPLRSGLIN